MVFYGYVDNGDEYIQCQITADSARAAYEKLERFGKIVGERHPAFRGNIECLMLRDENKDNICQSHIDDVLKCLEAYDRSHGLSLEGKLTAAAKESKRMGTGVARNDREFDV